MLRIGEHFVQFCWEIRVTFLVPDELATFFNESGEITVRVVDIIYS